MPLEYGITKEQKIKIGLKIIKPLLKKMYSDLSIFLEPNQEKERNTEIFILERQQELISSCCCSCCVDFFDDMFCCWKIIIILLYQSKMVH